MLNSGEWLAADMIIRFRGNYEDEELRDQEGTVRSVDLAVCFFVHRIYFRYSRKSRFRERILIVMFILF